VRFGCCTSLLLSIARVSVLCVLHCASVLSITIDRSAAPPPPAPGAGDPVSLNTLVQSVGYLCHGSVVEHSLLQGSWRIGTGALVSSVRSFPGLHVLDNTVVQELRVCCGVLSSVIVCVVSCVSCRLVSRLHYDCTCHCLH
jgi:hypothetical protein